MKRVEKEKRLEQQVYDAVDLLEQEFELEIDFYPEVIWVGRQGDFESSSLRERYEEDFQDIKEFKRGTVLIPEQIILLGIPDNYVVNEEAAHFYHYCLMGPEPDVQPKDSLALKIMSEMFGFFGSLIINPARKNTVVEEDYFQYFQQYKNKNFRRIARRKKISLFDFEEKIIYQQGYNLGERMFYAYIEGKLSKKRIQRFLKNNFPEKGQATRQFLKFRRDFWPID